MDIVAVFDKVTLWMRSVDYKEIPSRGLEIINLPLYEDAVKKFDDIKVYPGWCVYFWQRAIQYVDHVAIVPEQPKKFLNLKDAKLVHGVPPRVGKAYGPLSSPKDYAGIRVCTLHEYTRGEPNHYSRIAVGPLPGATKKQIAKAGKIAQEVGFTGLLKGKPAFYSLMYVDKLLFIKSFNYKDYANVRLDIPWIVAKKQLGSFFGWRAVYCGKLVGTILQLAGIKHVPKAKVLLFKGYQSSTFYEESRDKNSLRTLITWKEKLPLKY